MMTEDRLYEIARQQIDRKNRRWTLWSVNFIAFLLYVGLFTAFSGFPRNIGEFMLQAWFAALVVHTTALVLMQDQEAGIEGEVAKLRGTISGKPKRDGNRRAFSDDSNLDMSVELPNQRISRS